MSRVSLIGDKQIILAQPFAPPRGQRLIGRDRELRILTAAWIGGNRLPLSPLLVGEPGVGKNHLVFEMAARTGKKLFILQGHEDLSVEDLACTVRFSDDPARKMDYVASPLVTAMLQGEILFFDEVAKCRPRALAALVSVCDERRSIDSNLLGERIEARPGFRLVAATNTADLDGAAFPEFLRSRMRPVIPVGHPPMEEIAEILKHRYSSRIVGRLGREIEPLLDRFWSTWRQNRPSTPPTPRDAIHVFALAINLAEWNPTAGLDAGLASEAAPPVEVAHLDEAMHEFFRIDLETRQ